MLVLAKKGKTSTRQNCNPRIQKGPPLEKVTTPSLFGLVSHLARFRRWLTQQASANGCPASRSAENAATPPELRWLLNGLSLTLRALCDRSSGILGALGAFAIPIRQNGV